MNLASLNSLLGARADRPMCGTCGFPLERPRLCECDPTPPRPPFAADRRGGCIDGAPPAGPIAGRDADAIVGVNGAQLGVSAPPSHTAGIEGCIAPTSQDDDAALVTLAGQGARESISGNGVSVSHGKDA